MASFVVHYIACEKFLDGIDKYVLTKDDRDDFRLGNLVVDSIGITNYSRSDKLSKKMITHFRDDVDYDRTLQLPNIDKFINKYTNLVNNYYSAMGYLFHLYTDRLFFEYLYNSVLICFDKDMKMTDSISNNYYVKVIKTNKIYRAIDFYGEKYGKLYRDYLKVDRYLIDKYNVDFNYEELRNFSLSKFYNPGIVEIDYGNIFEVILKLKNIFDSCGMCGDYSSDVFDIDDIESLILKVVDGFNCNFSSEIKSLMKRR